MRRTLLTMGSLMLLSYSSVSPASAPEGLLGILQTELQRNFEILKKEPVRPYFLSYAVDESRSTRIQASFGALMYSGENRSRTGDVELRTGDYELDNSRQIRGEFSGGFSGFSQIRLPLSDDEKAIRTILWRTTDRRFKRAVERLSKVKTDVATKVKEENPAPDFSREEPVVHVGSPANYSFNTKEWENRLRKLTALFADNPMVYRGDATLSVEANNRFFVSSEGSRIATGQTVARLFIQSMTKASDGMELPLYASYLSFSPAGLPKEEQLLADVREMIHLLDQLRAAPVVEPFSGPAILAGRASGVFFHEIFGHRIEGHRQKNTDDAQTFAKKVGQQVLPAFLSVVFDPTMQRHGSTELVGHYLFDDEGVQAHRVVAVEKGILKTFLMSRSPLVQFPKSNGHGRRQPGFRPVARQSNLVVESAQSVPYGRLVEMLKEECRKQGKPFGLLFQNIEGGFTFTGRVIPNAFNVLPNVVYRIYTDSRAPELVRGVDLIGTPLTAFGKILATADKYETFNGICGAESGGVPVSASSPAILVGEVEVQKKLKSNEPLPILPAPAAKSKSGPTH